MYMGGCCVYVYVCHEGRAGVYVLYGVGKGHGFKCSQLNTFQLPLLGLEATSKVNMGTGKWCFGEALRLGTELPRAPGAHSLRAM